MFVVLGAKLGKSIVAAAALAMAQAQGAAQAPRVLTTAHEAHALSPEDAARAHPVHLARVMVRYYDPFLGLLFLGDSTGGIFADMRGEPQLAIKAGDLLTVDGVSGPGDVGPVISHPRIRVVGRGVLPPAPRVSFDTLSTGECDGQWVEVEGIVHSVVTPGHSIAYQGHAATGAEGVMLTLAMGTSRLDVITLNPEKRDYSSLVDAKVRLRASAGPRFNQRRQMTGVHLFMPEMNEIRVIEAASADPFSLPLTQTPGVMRYAKSELGPGHRIRIRGIVTATPAPNLFSVADGDHGMFIRANGSSPVTLGDVVDVVGFPAIGDYSAVLEDAIYRRLGSSEQPAPKRVAVKDAMAGDYDAEPVTVAGRLVYTSRHADATVLLLSDGGNTYEASMQEAGDGLPWLEEGSELEVTGICQIQTDAYKMPKGFRILLRSPDSVVVVSRPSWWTQRNTLRVLGLGAVLVLGALVWIVVLRRQVEKQTEVIRKSEDRLRHLSHHDPLTGLPNRILLDERMNQEMAKRPQRPLALLMVDLDHFKEVNDSLGHEAGDRLLCSVADHLSASVRKYDTVARVGGDEFVVLLPDLPSVGDAESVAAKIVTCLSKPFGVGKIQVTVSASVGVCTHPEAGTDAATLLRSADAAMYCAKAAGRNRFSVYSAEMADRVARA